MLPHPRHWGPACGGSAACECMDHAWNSQCATGSGPAAALLTHHTTPAAVARCCKAVAPYTCPRCHKAYCTSACYKQHSHQCTEAFYR